MYFLSISKINLKIILKFVNYDLFIADINSFNDIFPSLF